MNHRAGSWVTEALERSPTEKSLPVGPRRIACSIWEPEATGGQVRTVLLIHGAAASRSWWNAIGPHLGERFRVVALDLWGHGDSSREAEYSLDTWVDEIVETRRQFCPDGPIALVGHSLGGLIALKSAWRDPSLASQLVLLDTPLRRHTKDQLSKRERIGRSPLKRHPSKAAAMSAFKTVPPPRGAPMELMRHLAERSVAEVRGEWELKVDPRTYLRRTSRQEFLRPWPSGTTVIRSEYGLIDADMAADIKELLGSRGRLIDMAGQGHNMLLENPYATCRLLSSVLA